MRNYILQQYTTLSPSTTVLGHNGSCHTRVFFQTLLGLLGLWIFYIASTHFVPAGIMIIQWISGIGGVIVYFRFIIEFLNKYLDALIITPQGILVFEWDGFLQYKLQQFDRDNIESISHSQHSLSDKIIGKGTIQISIEHGMVFNFDNISSPHRIATHLRNQKQQYGSHHHQPAGDHHLGGDSSEKFEILVETLGEVIKDYMGRNHELPHKEKRDM